MIQSTNNINSQNNGQAIADRITNLPVPLRTKRQRKRRIWRVVASVMALLGLVAMIVAAARIRGASISPTADPVESHAVPVKAFKPSAADSYQINRSYTGVIVARRKTELGFELPGKVIRVLVDAGAEVNEGAPLAELDVDRLKIKREELLARQAQAQSVLDELLKGPRHETIDAARFEINRIQAQIDLQEKTYARRKSLVAQNAVSLEEFEEAFLTLKASKAELAGAKQRLLELTNGTRPEKISAQRAGVNQISLQIANVDVDLKKSVLRAPFAGRIATRLVDEGNVVSVGTSIFQLVEAHVLEAWIGVSPEFAAKLTAGDRHPVIVEGSEYYSRVSRLLPIVDQSTHTQTVILDLVPDNASETVVDGQVVRLQLETKVKEQGMWVPTTALEKSSRGLWTCYVLEGCTNDDDLDSTCRIARRFVEVLHTDGARAFVRGTIEPGEHIVSDATYRIVPGQLVRIGKELTNE